MICRRLGAALVLGLVAVGVVPPPTASAATPTGCGAAATPGVTVQHLTVDGVDRQYRLSIPSSYRPSTPAPLVFDFHGLGSNMDEQAMYTGLESAAGARGHVVITPQGRGDLLAHWSIPPLRDTKDDVDFVRAMLATTQGSLCIDADRVFSTGMSNGAMFSAVLACRLRGQLAAIAPVAGVNGARTCSRGTPPVSLLAFHGTEDQVVPYEGGALLSGALPVLSEVEARPVDAVVARWAATGGCRSQATTTSVAADVERVSYPGCRRGRAVELVRILGGGHTWPGAFSVLPDRLGSTTESVNATSEILDFFDAHPRPS